MKIKSGILPIVLLAAFVSVSAKAQYAVETGAGFYASTQPHSLSWLSVLRSLDEGKTWLYTTVEARGVAQQQPIYSSRTGIERLLESAGPFSIYGEVQAGVATSATATSGAFSGGGKIAWQWKPSLAIVLGGQALTAPTAGGWQPLLTIGFRFTPGAP